jgi:hypothetical protein
MWPPVSGWSLPLACRGGAIPGHGGGQSVRRRRGRGNKAAGLPVVGVSAGSCRRVIGVVGVPLGARGACGGHPGVCAAARGGAVRDGRVLYCGVACLAVSWVMMLGPCGTR